MTTGNEYFEAAEPGTLEQRNGTAPWHISRDRHLPGIVEQTFTIVAPVWRDNRWMVGFWRNMTTAKAQEFFVRSVQAATDELDRAESEAAAAAKRVQPLEDRLAMAKLGARQLDELIAQRRAVAEEATPGEPVDMEAAAALWRAAQAVLAAPGTAVEIGGVKIYACDSYGNQLLGPDTVEDPDQESYEATGWVDGQPR